MNQIKSRLTVKVETVLENVKRIQQYENKIPKIELDVLLESIRNIYVDVLELDKYNALVDGKETELFVEKVLQQNVVEYIVEQIPTKPEVEENKVEDTLNEEEGSAMPVSEQAETDSTEEVKENVEAMEDVAEEEHHAPEAEAETSEEQEVDERAIIDELSDNSADVLEDKFDEVVENANILKEIATKEVLEVPVIMSFEPIEKENEQEAEVEENPEQSAEPVVRDEDIKEDTKQKERQDEGTAKAKEEKGAKAVVNENTESPRQISLFDYLKSSSVTKATEQVDRFSNVGVKTLADKFQESKVKGNALYEERQEKDIKQQRVEDLRTVIGVNDKFLFINELFAENMRAYNEFIMQLTKMNNTEDAVAYLKTIEEKYNWDRESLAVQTFIKVFERKFK